MLCIIHNEEEDDNDSGRSGEVDTGELIEPEPVCSIET